MNNSLSAILLDDDNTANELLQELLISHHPEVTITGVFNNISDALLAIAEQTPTLLFLDIEMPGKDGFSFFELLNKIGINIQVVIVSAHLPKYYSKALDLELTLYLEKPVWEKELKEILDKVHGRIANKQSFDKIPFTSLLDAKRKILLNTPRGTIYLYPEEILYARADKKCTDIWIRNVGKVKVSKGITDVYHLLNDFNIYKPDKSWLINLMYLKEIIEPSETLKIAVNDMNYHEITITSEGFSNLKQHIKKFKNT